MFCTKCGTKLEDNAKFCPQCGTKIAGGSGSVASVDLQNMKSKTSSVISALRNLDKRKTLYGIIISFVLIILFGCTTVKALNPVKEVKGKITWAGDIYTNDSGGNIWERDYYQSIRAAYNGEEWNGSVRVLRYDNGYSSGDSIPLYIVDGELTRDKDAAKVNVVGAGFSILLLLGSIGSCGWFTLQYFKKRG